MNTNKPRRKADVAQQRINWIAIVGLIFSILTTGLIYRDSALAQAESTGRLSQAIEGLADKFEKMETAFDDYKREMKNEVKEVNNKLMAINAEVATNSALNKKQVDVYEAEAIATKVVNATMTRMHQTVNVRSNK